MRSKAETTPVAISCSADWPEYCGGPFDLARVGYLGLDRNRPKQDERDDRERNCKGCHVRTPDGRCKTAGDLVRRAYTQRDSSAPYRLMTRVANAETALL